jgi:3-phosphoshikimate 1-carboxyvinyltransferase
MQERIELFLNQKPVHATVHLPASKSISNRVLILEAISDGIIHGKGYSDADDTQKLKNLLHELPEAAYAGAGGTTFRFLLAFLATKKGYEGILSGTDRLMERPVSLLVDALRALGASIEYLGIYERPPLHITGKRLEGGTISLNSEVSSQFLTSLLLIAPSFKNGLTLIPSGTIASRPYLDMTLKLLQQCGVLVEDSGKEIKVFSGSFKQQEIEIEKDWSAASYFYSLVALSENGTIELPGLRIESLQGDAKTCQLYNQLGVETVETVDGIILRKKDVECTEFSFDFSEQPDLAQTLAVTCVGLGIKARMSGLESLRVKETDRIMAIRTELGKLNVHTEEPKEGSLLIDPKTADFSKTWIVETYEDHRMAMAFAPLLMKCSHLVIRDPHVVRKSFPDFWIELRKAGIESRTA